MRYIRYIIAYVLLLLAFYLIYVLCAHAHRSVYGSILNVLLSEGALLISLSIGNLIYQYSEKGSLSRKFLQVMLWWSLAVLLFSFTRSCGLGFHYSILIGYPGLAACSYFISRYYSRYLSNGRLWSALLLSEFIMEWLARIFFWDRMEISFPSSLFFLLGLVTGVLLHKKRHYMTYLFTVVCLAVSVWIFTDDYRLWLNKVNYGTFTGKVERKFLKDYRFLNEKGDTVRLSDWKGKKVLIDCWTKHCGVCYRKMPVVQRLHERYKGSNKVYVTSLFVTYRNDKKEDGAKIVKEEGFSFPVWSIDKTHELLSNLKIDGYPCVLIFDEEGCLIFHGSIEGAEELLEKETN